MLDYRTTPKMDAPMKVPSHHKRGEICTTRPVYRDGKTPRAIKVYTINQESSYLLVQGVPAVGASADLIKLFALYGAIQEYRVLDEYPTADQFTDVYLIKFEKIQAARIARRKLDDWSFFGGVLHVCYAPEHESVEETRLKLQDRRRAVAARIRKNEAEHDKSKPKVSSDLDQLPDSAPSPQASVSQGQRSNNQRQQSSAEGKGHLSAAHINSRSNERSSYTPEQLDSPWQHDRRVPTLPNMAQEFPGEAEPQFWIPSPPKEQNFRGGNSKHLFPNYEFARVRTAHSEYPVNCDARLSTDSDKKQESNNCSRHVVNDGRNIERRKPGINIKTAAINNTEFKKNYLDSDSCQVGGDGKDNDSMKDSDHQLDVEKQKCKDSLVKANLQGEKVVRNFKSKSVSPKFIPRQMMNLPKKSTDISFLNTVKDHVNNELRKNALILGEAHGPVAEGQGKVLEITKVTETDVSVEKTREEIRKRISDITGEENILKKKAKPS